MSNTAPDPNDQPNASQPGENFGDPPTDPAAGGPPATPGPQPTPGSNGAEAPLPEKKRFGGFFGGLADEWKRGREFKRQMQQAAADKAAADQEKLSLAASQAHEDQANPQQPDDMKQERAKRIRMISEFSDIKESLDHKIKRWVSGFACAVVPWLLVVFLTGDVGEYFAGQPFTASNFKILGIFGITALLEMVIAVVTNAWGNTVHDMNATDVAMDKQKLKDRARSQAIAWGVLSTVSGFALFMFLMQQRADATAISTGALTQGQLAQGMHAAVTYALDANMINVVLRCIGTLAIDPACVFAVHQTTKNLDQFLKQQNQVTTAITQIADTFDKQEEAAARAQLRQRENERFLELKGKMDDVNAEMMGKMGDKLLAMSDQMFQNMQIGGPRIVDADDDDDAGRNVRRLRR